MFRFRVLAHQVVPFVFRSCGYRWRVFATAAPGSDKKRLMQQDVLGIFDFRGFNTALQEVFFTKPLIGLIERMDPVRVLRKFLFYFHCVNA